VQKGLKRPEKVKPASAGCFLGIIVSSPSRSLLFKPRQKSFSLASQTTPPLWLVTFLVTSFGDILILVRLLRISICWSLALQEQSRFVCRAHCLRNKCYSGVCFLNGLGISSFLEEIPASQVVFLVLFDSSSLKDIQGPRLPRRFTRERSGYCGEASGI